MTPSLLMAVLRLGHSSMASRQGRGYWRCSASAPPTDGGPGRGFSAGILLGDVVWCSTALIAIVGAREIGSTAFDVLGVLSGAVPVLARLARGARAQR